MTKPNLLSLSIEATISCRIRKMKNNNNDNNNQFKIVVYLITLFQNVIVVRINYMLNTGTMFKFINKYKKHATKIPNTNKLKT